MPPVRYRPNRMKSNSELFRERQIVLDYMEGRQWVNCTRCQTVLDFGEDGTHARITVHPAPRDEVDEVICADCEED